MCARTCLGLISVGKKIVQGQVDPGLSVLLSVFVTIPWALDILRKPIYFFKTYSLISKT